MFFSLYVTFTSHKSLLKKHVFVLIRWISHFFRFVPGFHFRPGLSRKQQRKVCLELLQLPDVESLCLSPKKWTSGETRSLYDLVRFGRG